MSKQKAEIIFGMAEVYGKEMGETAIRMYLAALSEFSDEAVTMAASRLMRTSKWFPRPSEIIEIIEAGTKPNTQALAMEAWAKVLEHIRGGQWRYRGTGDPATDEAVRMMSGWSRMGEMLTSEIPFREKEFAEKFVLTADSAGRIEGPVAEPVAGLLEGIGDQNE